MRAPELVGRRWLNTGGESCSIKDFRGRVLLLDFWSFCCINCLHVLDELRPLEEEFADELVTVGVHSPKFEHEADPDALAAAVERYAVRHPVLDDPQLSSWQNYAVKAWPTLVVVDPEGYIVHVAAGEGHAEALRAVIGDVVAEHDAKGTLQRGEGPYVPPETPTTTLRFPGKVIGLEGGTVLVSDSAQHSLVEFAADGETVVRRIGSGERGSTDGPAADDSSADDSSAGGPFTEGRAEVARFSEPAGLALLPESVASEVGYDVVVADTVNHLLRGVSLADGRVTTVAGTGQQWRSGPAQPGEESLPALQAPLTSPWDVCWWEPAGGLVVAMAGNHTLGLFDPVAGEVRRFAGTTVEGLRDGETTEAFFAQPSGLADGGRRLWLVDSETSALRWIEACPHGAEHGFEVHTAVGTGLFDFGHADGPADQALLQHPLGVEVLPDGTVAVCDTYNGAIRRYDPGTGEVSTLATDVAEPSGATVLDGELVVVASTAHRLERPVPPGVTAQLIRGAAQQVTRPATEIAPGEVELAVVFTPPPGQKLDERYGPSTRLEVSASPEGMLLEGAGTGTELTRRLVVAEGRESGAAADGVLHVVAQAASCDDDAEVEHPACRLTRQDWGVPIRATAAGADRLPLVMGGMDHPES
ncbi:thiol-disulfide isomerase/thioredoxin [Halopolyspora algeriensis]|uniref:Thiol-disulfide isomerase/thioredoxin n=1 Tax=Halopolyspora algeriensis TaxID=1500506 RepID=A0A368W3D0_9ACTN|nr:NHL domain-containing thioredoxin family protein [Halopolyspora algeriensis]RCW47183.1 thiol-disulfide isomerase/thioredoxin [Halopolyspora algeriensis]TQM48269.1 thiol-disulfide isomerase/thioredoxin [Halopolyspora algeriensis]